MVRRFWEHFTGGDLAYTPPPYALPSTELQRWRKQTAAIDDIYATLFQDAYECLRQANGLRPQGPLTWRAPGCRVCADSPPAAINPATAAAPDVVSYWRADPADLVTLTIVKLPEQDTELRWQAAILHQALRDISAWPVSDTIHAAWRCRAIKVDAIVDLHRNLVTGLERKWPYDLSREVRILARAHHTFGGLTERWTDMFAAVLP